MKKIGLAISMFLMLCCVEAFSQESCASLLTEEYVSNGQYYTTNIEFSETKECDMTFLEGNEYRIIVCPRLSIKINMQLIDSKGNILFDNKKYDYTNYWNFQVKKTITCKAKLTLVENNIESDEIILLIGFKK
ncbi:MAG: hypothetical protein MJ198_09710 [Bacteroidales bacterium]|nr:hypothetical protein [Bacteroidales bacterium]